MDAAANPNQANVLPELQRAMQFKLGGCLLRLQQYELLLKAMVAHAEVAGPPAQLEALRDEQIAGAQRKTLGSLVGMLTEGYLSSADSHATTKDDAENDPPSDGAWFRTRYRMVMDVKRYETTRAELKELVDLRNDLVHHLLQRFDVSHLEGCTAAVAYLNSSREVIDARYLTLRAWAQQMEESRVMMAAFVDSPSFKDLLIDGITPDSEVHWPVSGIVRSLREAEAAVGQAGWTELNAAIEWQRHHAPKQTPTRYGCSSWRHVLHESQQFEVRMEVPANGTSAVDGRVVWYRSQREELTMLRAKKQS